MRHERECCEVMNLECSGNAYGPNPTKTHKALTNPPQTCGVQRWEEISAEQYKLVTKILSRPGNPRSIHGCRTTRNKLPFIQRLWNKLPIRLPTAWPMPPSSAAQRYKPAGSPSFISPPRQAALSPGPTSSSSETPIRHHRPDYSVRAVGTRAAMPDMPSPTRTWILLSVKGSRKTLTPAEIPVNSRTTDYTAFQELKTCYQKHRGRLRLWFSIWRLDNCEVVKV